MTDDSRRIGDADVRFFLTATDSDMPIGLGPVADVTVDGSTVLYTRAGSGWRRGDDTVERMRDRDQLVSSARFEDLTGPDRESALRLEHQLEQVALARRTATDAHAGQVDKNGEPYIDHPRRVATRLDGLEEQAVAWLHDVLEDTDLRTSTLLDEGVDLEITDAVLLLSRRPGKPADLYYEEIRGHPVALAVKLADLADNTDPARTARLDPETRERLARKYEHAGRAFGAEEEAR